MILPATTAANIAVSLFWLMAMIQVLVAIGGLPITILWGSSQQQLTPGLRLASLMACCILLGMAAIIRRRSQVASGDEGPPPEWVRMTAWAIVGYMVLNTAGNFSSSNPVEKYLFGTMTLILAIATAIVAAAPAPHSSVPIRGEDTYGTTATYGTAAESATYEGTPTVLS